MLATLVSASLWLTEARLGADQLGGGPATLSSLDQLTPWSLPNQRAAAGFPQRELSRLCALCLLLAVQTGKGNSLNGDAQVLPPRRYLPQGRVDGGKARPSP